MIDIDIKSLPTSPGVYQYLDKNFRLLYVGKAKNLKKRVSSYFDKNLNPALKLSLRISKMIQESAHLRFVLTTTENDALILENSLIKQLAPKYNILLRDDKTYPYISYNENDFFPRFTITRKPTSVKGVKNFGPFASGANEILEAIYDIFALVQKPSCLREKRACLFAQIGKCHAPCEGKISSEDYKKIFNEALHFIKNKNKIIKKLEEKMIFYSNNLEFEEAQKIKLMIKKISDSSINSSIDLAKIENFDVFCVENAQENACAVKIFVREGKVVSSSFKKFRFELDFDKNEAYKMMFLNTPKEQFTCDVYVGDEFKERPLINEWIKNVNVKLSQRGNKKKLIELAKKNALEILALDKTALITPNAIKDYFALEKLPLRIECFDNSHLQGSHCVGAMVVYFDNDFIKQDYRHYKLESTNEYEQMKELLSKRAQNFEQNPPPDLWLIDGGATLVNLAKIVLESYGVFIDVIGISKEKVFKRSKRAKGGANDILHHLGETYKLENNDKKLMFLQKIRDEAHRFAIGFHRQQKRKSDMQISLLEANGIGRAKVKRLLDFFGEFQAIKTASFDELKTALNEKDAINLMQIFKNNP